MLLPKEHEMASKDKYTVFSSTSRGYRKGIHKVPKWTRVCPPFTLVKRAPHNRPLKLTLRVNPKGF